MESPERNYYSVGELAERGGVSRRTVRFYVSRGLIDPPSGRGRGSTYTDRHLQQIHSVRSLQRGGLELDEIRKRGSTPLPTVAPRQASIEPPSFVVRIPICPGVRLELDADTGLPEPSVLDELATHCARVLRGSSRESSDTEKP